MFRNRTLLHQIVLIFMMVVELQSTQIYADVVDIDIDLGKPTVELSPVLYGLFYEDINYAADGGLYAELVQNRSFEYYKVGGREQRGRRFHPLTAWEKVEREGGVVALKVIDKTPLNSKNTKYLKIKALGPEGTVGVRNTGFAGIVLQQGGKYDFSVYAKRSEKIGNQPITVALESNDGKILASTVFTDIGTRWRKLDATLIPSAADSAAQLVITTSGGGELMLDMVSLFPQDTFRGRKNGMRKDLAQALADLHPGFLRFPGGCVAHGHGLENTYRWKDTVGDVAQRKPNWNLWGYHQTYGLGYFEYMQLCEDIGATPLPVLPVGVTCGFRPPFDKVPLDELQPWIDDTLDLIEFANGSVDSKWGKIRSEMGHPESFNLKYICLGNEEHDTPEFRERFPLFVKALRKQHPEIRLIGNSGLGQEIPLFDLMVNTRVFSTDEHYYSPPEWYLANTNRFDSFNRSQPKIFVGEYASEGNSLFNAVAEAAYLTGVERNADIVDMTCYAPLFAKVDYTQWPKANLIWFDNTDLMKTPNYYVQQLFSQNKGDVYLENKVTMRRDTDSRKRYGGRVGIGTWKTTIQTKQPILNQEILEPQKWGVVRGDFNLEQDVYTQSNLGTEAAISLAPPVVKGNTITYSIRAKKTGGNEGFLVVFGYENDDNYYWWNIGGWGNTEHAIQAKKDGGTMQRLVSVQGSIESNRWYDLKIELTPGRIRCYLDGTLIHDFEEQYPTVSVSPTFDKSKGELIVKIVNPCDIDVDATLNIQGPSSLDNEAKLIVLSGGSRDKNTIGTETIKPITKTIAAGKIIKMKLPSTSVQVLRLKVTQ